MCNITMERQFDTHNLLWKIVYSHHMIPINLNYFKFTIDSEKIIKIPRNNPLMEYTINEFSLSFELAYSLSLIINF